MRIKAFLIVILLIFDIFSSRAQENVSSAAWALGNLLQYYGKKVPPENFENSLQNCSYDKLAKTGKTCGLYLNHFILKYKKDLIKITEPFIAKFQGRYCVIKSEKDKLEVSSRGGKKIISREEFLDAWSGDLISVPLTNVLLERYSSRNARGRIIFLYSYHKEPFYLFKQIFDQLYQEAKQQGYKVIYIDELGLIPEDSVEKLVQSDRISEKAAFLKARSSLLSELKLIEKGVGIYDPTKFYHKIYTYLARFRIYVNMENLQYENWKAIVTFDELNLNELAVNLFCHGNIERYLDIVKQYNEGFWQYNVIIRDRFFKRQMEEIASENPHSLIFTLRGLGHFGLESNFKVDGFTTETMILGKGNFFDLLVPDQLIQILKRNDVRLSSQTTEISYLRAFPVECLRNYFQKKLNFSITEATIKANQIIRRADGEDIKRLSLNISHMISEGRLRNPEAIYEYVFSWARQMNLVLRGRSSFEIVKP